MILVGMILLILLSMILVGMRLLILLSRILVGMILLTLVGMILVDMRLLILLSMILEGMILLTLLGMRPAFMDMILWWMTIQAGTQVTISRKLQRIVIPANTLNSRQTLGDFDHQKYSAQFVHLLCKKEKVKRRRLRFLNPSYVYQNEKLNT